MATHDEIVEVKQRVAAALLSIPGVVAVGLGRKEIGGTPTDGLVVKVYVREKKPAESVPPDELIPAQIDGVPTDVIQMGDIVPLTGPPGVFNPAQRESDDTRYRPLTGGGQIVVKDSNDVGTLGCFLRHTTDTGKFYGLTSHHVLDVPDTPPLQLGVTNVGQPSGRESCTECCNDIIGTYAGGEKTGDRDEALVQLAPGSKWLAEITGIGVVADKYTITRADVETETYAVRKRGAATGLTGGTISALEATTNTADNVFLIAPNRPSPDPDPTLIVFFGYFGDSGSALVNDQNKVVGLVYGGTPDGFGAAYPIENVLSRFASTEHITVDLATATAPGQVKTVPDATMLGAPVERVAALTGAPAAEPVLAAVGRPGFRGAVPPEPQALGRLQADLDRSATGRLLVTLWLEHQDELIGLVRHNRRITLAWHRGGGAALFQLLIRMPADPDLALPDTMNGQPLSQCVDQLYEVLARFATSRLKADLALAHATLPDLAGLTYPQILAAFDET